MPGADRNARDRACIERILDYCVQVSESLEAIQSDKSSFMASHIYQNAVAMCILQIGELVKQLSPAFLSEHAQIPWRLIAKTRDIYAHHYGAVDFDLVWATATEDVPVIADFCRQCGRGGKVPPPDCCRA